MGQTAEVHDNNSVPLEVSSLQHDEVFPDEDAAAAAVSDSDVMINSTSVFDFAVKCLRRHRPDLPAVVSKPE